MTAIGPEPPTDQAVTFDKGVVDPANTKSAQDGMRLVDDLEQQLSDLRKHNEELLEKISLDDCACSYDEAGDVCSLHSPVVAALRADIEHLQFAVDEATPESEIVELRQQLADLRAEKGTG